MTHVYLTGIQLSEFRTFASLTVDLKPEPGVLIVHGSNGLGKSSLFDALEWTLTGDIDHFTSVDGYEKFGSYLCRWGNRSEPTSSTLTFSDGHRIERQLDGIKAKNSTLSGISDVAEYLRLPDWNAPIVGLDRYLLLTHFLGQSSLSRLTYRKPGERLEILREVSRSASLQKFGLALHGPGQTLPARAFAKRIDQLQRDVANLNDALAQENNLWSVIQASGALDDSEAEKLAGEIAKSLSIAWLKIGGTPPPFNHEKMWKSGEIQSRIDRCAELARGRELAISEARRLLGLHDRHRRFLAETSRASEAAERDLIGAAAAAETAKQEAEHRRAALAAATGPLATARDAHARVVAFREAASACESARVARELAERELANARATLDQAEQVVQQGERWAQFEARLVREIADFDQRLGVSRDLIHRVHQWLNHEDLILKIEADLHDLRTRYPDIDNQVDIASSKLAAARTAEAAAREALRIIESSVSALSNAVSTVAKHLPSDAHDCPVCATHFTSAEDLSARATAAAERLAPQVIAQRDVLSKAQAVVAKATTNFAELRDVAERLASLTAQRNAERDNNALLLKGFGLTEAASRSTVGLWLAERVDQQARLENSRRVRARWLGRLTANGRAIPRVPDAIRQRDATRRIEATVIRRLEDCSVAEQVADERFSASAARLFPSGSPTREQIDEAITIAASTLALAQKAYDNAVTALSEQELRLGPLQQAEANLRARIAQAAADKTDTLAALSDLARQWHAAGWADEDMQEGKIEVIASELNQARQSLAEADALLKRLRNGREAWNRQIAHRVAIDRLRELVDLAPNSTRDQIREIAAQKVQALNRDVTATTESKKIASTASNLIDDAVNEFNAAYLDPLKLLINRINQAILCDPRIGIDLSLQRRGIKQSASVAGEMPKDLGKVDPMLVHSEGQMAALAVSMLCAASLTYPWSRWRALILDDPLQHNDAIHAAAFADFIGNMVSAKGYQVLLTTHDLGQAEFLKRKFGARNIPCAVLNLLGRGSNGVDWEFCSSSGGPPSNAAMA